MSRSGESWQVPIRPVVRQRRLTTSELAVVELRRMIEVGVLSPGSQLEPVVLAENLGVSRTPVREALVALRSEGFVELSGDSTIRVPLRDADSIDVQVDLLAGVYGMLASRIAFRAEPSALAEVAASAQQCASTSGEADSTEEWISLLRQFRAPGVSRRLSTAASIVHSQIPEERIAVVLGRSGEAFERVGRLSEALQCRSPGYCSRHCSALIAVAKPSLRGEAAET